MNILIINHYAGNPNIGMEYRPYYIAKEWLQSGHTVTIIGAKYSHLRTKQPEVTSEEIEGINYVWLKTIKYQDSGLLRILNILSFLFHLLIKYRKIIDEIEPDVVIASSTYTLDIFPAYLIAKKRNAKLVFELHDMWPLSPMIIGGYSKNHPFIRAVQIAENFACRKADHYVSILANTKEHLIKHGLNENKFHHIPNGFCEAELINGTALPDEHQDFIKKLKNSNKILIGYTGGFAPSNALDTLLNVAGKITETNLHFVLVGEGPLKKELINKSISENLSNVTFLPAIPKTSIQKLLEMFDILYAGGIKSYLHTFGTSYNKITDYMLSAKPIIFSVDDPETIVKVSNCGFQVPAENTDAIIEAINKLCKMSSIERAELGINGKHYAESNLNYKILSRRFLEAILK